MSPNYTFEDMSVDTLFVSDRDIPEQELKIFLDVRFNGL
jgi:hypothetical protein